MITSRKLNMMFDKHWRKDFSRSASSKKLFDVLGELNHPISA